MATITANTTIPLTPGQVLLFGIGGTANVIIDGSTYFVGRADAAFGPYTSAKTVIVQSVSGAVVYGIDSDSDLSNVVKWSPISGQIESTAAQAAVRGGLPVPLNARASAVMGAVQVQCDGYGAGRIVGDLKSLVPLPITVNSTNYYVNAAAANDAGDGLTWATAKQKISSAITLGNSAAVPFTINVAAGVYDRNKSFAGSNGATVTVPTQPCVIRAVGGSVICHAAGALSWSVEAGTTYKATRSNVNRVLDWATRDADGEFVELAKVATLAACTSTPGTWYTDNVTVYVNRTDGAVVADANTGALLLNVDGIETSSGGNMHLIGIHQYGGANGAFRPRNAANHRVYAEDCRFGFTTNATGADAVVSLDLDLFVGLRCIASHAQKDGFNFHIANSKIPKAVLVDCVGFENGTVTSQASCNGVTMHDGGLLIDINGRYYRNNGGDCAHVDSGTEAWHIGTVTRGSYGDIARGGETPAGTGYLAGVNANVRLYGALGDTLTLTGGVISRA